MMHPRPLKLILLITSLLSFPTAYAQQASSTANKETDAALRQKAFDLLDSVTGQIGIMQSPENRARVAANVAASIWEHDESKARSLLMSVQEDINAGLRITEGDSEADRHRRMVFLQLRVNTVERIAKYDGELALAFFRNTALPPPPPQMVEENVRRHYRDYTVEYHEYEERAFELSLAQQIADKSPEVSVTIARQSLVRGFSNELISVLRQLNRKHPEQAQTLFSEIIDKLKHTDLTSDSDTFYFATNLAGSLPASANSESVRELANLFLAVAEAKGCNKKSTEDDERSYFCQQIGRVLPVFDKVSAGRSAAFKQWRPDEADDYQYSPWQTLNEVGEEGSVDDILALAAKYPQLKANIYERAFYKAQTTGDLDRARKIVGEMPEEAPARRYLTESLERQEKVLARFQESLKDIDRALDGMKKTEERIDFLLHAAGSIAPTDQKEAVKLLNRANGFIETMKPGSEQLSLQMIVAIKYSIYNSTRGIVLMESLMPKLNELVSAASKLDGYETHHLRDGEWNMSAEGDLGMVLTNLSQSAPYFAWCDFDRAASVAGQFERPELRLMAQVKLAQGILAGRPKPPKESPAPRQWDY